MQVHVIDFSPPATGFETFFNTFRLGIAWARRLQPGERVLLMDNKQHIVFGAAEVISVKIGPLGEMAAVHAAYNHNQLGKPDAAANLIAASIKRYGPHKVNVDKKYSVIYLRRIPMSAEHFLNMPETEHHNDD